MGAEEAVGPNGNGGIDRVRGGVGSGFIISYLGQFWLLYLGLSLIGVYRGLPPSYTHLMNSIENDRINSPIRQTSNSSIGRLFLSH